MLTAFQKVLPGGASAGLYGASARSESRGVLDGRRGSPQVFFDSGSIASIHERRASIVSRDLKIFPAGSGGLGGGSRKASTFARFLVAELPVQGPVVSGPGGITTGRSALARLGSFCEVLFVRGPDGGIGDGGICEGGA